MGTKSPKKKLDRKKLISFLLVAGINVAIVVYIAVNEFGEEAKGAGNIAGAGVKPVFLVLALACLGVAVLMEYLKYRAMIIATEGRDDPRGAFECAILGKYYDNITPLGAGGQPFQIIYLKKRGLSGGASAALPIAGFLSLQFAFVLAAAVVFIFNGAVTRDIAAIRISAYVGLAFYLFVPLCILLFTFFPRAFGRAVAAGVRLFGRLHIVKDCSKTTEKVLASLGDYGESLKLLHESPHLLGLLLALSLVYQVAVMSVPFFVLLAFGGISSWWTVFSLVVFIYCAITIIPTPGNSGAAEGSFYVVFAALASGNLFWAILVWRLIVYYGWLILGLLVITRQAMPRRKPRAARAMPAEPLRVAVFTDFFYPRCGGTARTADAFARRLNRDGGGCCVVCPDSGEPLPGGLPYEVLRASALRLGRLPFPAALPGLSLRLRRELRRQKPDVIHALSPFAMGRFAVAMGRRLNIPVVATFRSRYYDDALDLTHSRFLARCAVNGMVAFYSRADAVWACGEGAREALRGYGFHGEIELADSGADTAALESEETLRALAVKRFSIPAGKHILLYAGRLEWQKGLRLVLDTASRLRVDGDNYFTVIAGGGRDASAVRDMADSLRLGGCVEFAGEIGEGELLRGLYLASDLLLLPSEYDLAPLVLREAAVMGTPALLIEGSAAAAPVRNGVNGYTAAPNCTAMAERVRAIMAGGDLAAVGQKARETIPLSWDDVVARTAARYRLAQRRSFERVDIRAQERESAE